MKIEIKEATKLDAERILKVENEVFNLETASSITHALEVESFKYFYINFEEECVGYIALSLLSGEGEILSIAVLEQARGKGLGKKLMDFAMEFFASKKVSKVFLEVAVSNVVAQKLYLSFGFSEIYRRKNYYQHKDGTSEDAIIMEKIFE